MTIEQSVPDLVALTPDAVDMGQTIRRVIEAILATSADPLHYRPGVFHDATQDRLAFFGRAPAASSDHPFFELDQTLQGTIASLHRYYPEALYRFAPQQPTLTTDGVFAKHGIIMPLATAIEMKGILPTNSPELLAGLPASIAGKKASMVQISTEVSLYQPDDFSIVREDDYASLAIVTLPAQIRQAVVSVILQLV